MKSGEDKKPYDAVIVGSGPNGLAAGITLARAGRSVLILEASSTIGGGTRTAELTLPGFRHDVCSAIHPLGKLSPFFQELRLERFGLEWIDPPYALAHPLDDGSAVVLEECVEISELLSPFRPREVYNEFLGPLRWPRHPLMAAKFGWLARTSAMKFAQRKLRTPQARALWAGLAAHSIQPLENACTSAFALMLALSAKTGWPVARGGSQAIANALAACFHELGGEIAVGVRVDSLAQLPPRGTTLFDLTPRQVLRIVGDDFPPRYRRRLNQFRYGPGVFKMDWALAGPIPWKAEKCRKTACVHVGGTLEEIAESERAPSENRISDKPFVLVAQQSLFDPTRAPGTQHTGWGYCHVPSGSNIDMTERIESQIERFAPGFRKLIVARHVADPAALEAYNANYVGGDINGGSTSLRQLLSGPSGFFHPYATALDGVYFCSSSTPPGGGVHGMCGYWAARRALKDMW